MIQAQNIKLSFGTQTIFEKISFIINQHDRVGLIGRNGSGKTTLLKSIIDNSVLNGGTINILHNKKIAYMPQEVVLESDLSILEETLKAFPELYDLQLRALELEKLLEHSPDQKSVEEYSDVLEKLASYSPEVLKAEAKKLLMGLGFSIHQFAEPVKNLSVGWKMRVVLAKLLLQNADFYLFDEPTNHLDLMTKEWFLDFLKEASFGFMIICHERYFLDELCTKIFELERGVGTWYTGNYTDSLESKESALKILESAYHLQQKDIEQKKATIARFKSSASKASMAQSMQKALDKMEKVVMPPSQRNVNFSFPPIIQSGKTVITVKDVAQKFGDKTLFANVSFEIERGQKIALIAPNGVGKTTLFNLIAGILPLQHGSVEFGHNVTHSIFAQDQNQVLDAKLTVLQNIERSCGHATEQTVRSFLGAFLFGNEAVGKKVKVLSGGEKNKLGMVGVLLQKANLLLLDEPTNHLDIPSKAIVLKALQKFAGTVLFVSHDRDFINDLATNIIELTPHGAIVYHGSYDEFVYQKKVAEKLLGAQNKIVKPTVLNHVGKDQSVSQPSEKNKVSDLAILGKQLEQKIAKIEQKIKSLEPVFSDFEYGSDEFSRALEQVEALDKQLKEVTKEWNDVESEIIKNK